MVSKTPSSGEAVEGTSSPFARPTIKDVARAANVSIATVSRVLSNAGLTTSETNERVKEAAAALGFRTNRAGSDLRSGHSRTIGVMLPSLRNPVFAECAESIQQAARADGWSVILTTTRYDRDYETQAIDALMSHRVSGIIATVADADHSEALKILDREGVPVVLVFNQPTQQCYDFVSIDNVEAAYAATHLLIERGHTRLMMVAGSLEQSDRSKRRREGFLAAISDAGLQEAEVMEVPFEQETADNRLLERLRSGNRPTAFFCSTDMLALRVISILKQAGISVPQDASVFGFDGIALGGFITPTLATVSQPCGMHGEVSFQRLLEKILLTQNRIRGGSILPYQLLERQTI